jgi:hypothetical protein
MMYDDEAAWQRCETPLFPRRIIDGSWIVGAFPLLSSPQGTEQKILSRLRAVSNNFPLKLAMKRCWQPLAYDPA